MNIRAKVMQEPTVIDAKYGPCIITKVRILQNGEDVAIFSKLGDPVAASKTKGQHVLIAKNAKGKYQIVDDTSSNGNNIQMNRPSSQQEGYVSTQESSYYTYSNNGSNTPSAQTYSQHASNAPNTAVNSIEVKDLGLPEPLTDAQKKAIHKLCIDRARLLTHCIEVMRSELNNKGLEFHEGSLRSLGVSLFIHISKNLP